MDILSKRVLAIAAAISIAFGLGCGTSRNLVIESNPPGATITVDGKEQGAAPVNMRVSWSDERHPVVVRAKRDGFEEVVKSLGAQEARVAPEPWNLRLDLPALRQERVLSIECNVDQAQVRVNGKLWPSPAPTQLKLTFKRETSSTPWSTATVDVMKERFRYKSPSGALSPAYSMTLGPSNFPDGGRLVVGLEPVQFFMGTIKRFVFTPEGVRTQTESVLSQVEGQEHEPKASLVSLISDSAEALNETRIAVDPTTGAIVYSIPIWKQGETDPYGSNLWLQRGVQRTRLTDGDFHDVTPSVSADGKWVYFSSDRSGKLCIHRIQTNGKGGIGTVTDSPSSAVDYEPIPSPDGSRVAFSSRKADAESGQIWICNSDGTLRTYLREGEQPAWSPDGSRIAYVAVDHMGKTPRYAIWVMDADGSNPRKVLYNADRDFRHPVWHPKREAILYECDGYRMLDGTPQFDIWIVNADGTQPVALTANASYDIQPAITPDGRSVYFLSNRGVQREFQNNLKIWRMDLLEGP